MSFETVPIILTDSSDWVFLFFRSLFCSHLRQIENDNHQNTRRAMETTPQKQSVVPLTEVFCFSESPPHLKIHSYRAAVQYVLTEMWPGFQHPTTRLVVKKGAEVPFPQYVSLVLVYLPCLSLSPILQYVSLVSVRLPSLSVSPLSQYVSLVLVDLPCLSLSPFPQYVSVVLVYPPSLGVSPLSLCISLPSVCLLHLSVSPLS